MVGMNPRLSHEGITEELVTKAAEFWGAGACGRDPAHAGGDGRLLVGGVSKPARILSESRSFFW